MFRGRIKANFTLQFDLSLCGITIDHIHILDIELELACNGGSCWGISLIIFACKKIARTSLDCKLIPVQY